jgi:hypothetical protein
MKKNIITYCLSILCFCFINIKAFAQYQGQVYKKNNLPTVLHYTDTLNSPWQGGLNACQLQMADLNNDGAKDIVIYDYVNNVISTFIHNTNNGANSYIYNPLYEANLPVGYFSPIRGYIILKDYNCDNIPDLFTRGQFGVSVSTGYYQANQLKFTFFKNLFFPGTFGPVNVYVQPGDIPAIEDIDYDGDLDILSFDVQGTVLNYYKNMRVEENLPCDSIKMSFAVNCWGQFTQGFIRTAFLGATCKGFEPTEIIYPTEEIEKIKDPETVINVNNKPKRHTGNCIVSLDADNDADKDLIIGGTGFSDINLLTNGGSSSLANIISQDTQYNSATGNKVFMPRWAATSFEDVDGDSIKDLICGSHCEKDGSLDCENNKLQFYKNSGTNTLPNFQAPNDSLIINEILDFGAHSFPTFYDYDHDGYADLFVGTEGFIDTSDYRLKAKIAYYKNNSTLNSYSFSLVTDDFLNLSTKKYNGLFPHFTDVTGDSITDLIMGGNNGKLILYKNMASSNMATPNFVWNTDSFLNADVGNYSAPTSADINKDGKKDLIIGNEYGKLIYYEDTSTVAGIKSYKNISNTLGAVNAGGKTNFLGYATPTFTKIDNTRREILLIGTGDGTIERYDSIYAPIYGPYVRTDSMYSLIQTPFRSTPAVADINLDGYYDMVIGSKMGGLQLFTQVLLVDSLPIVIGNGIQHIIKNKSFFKLFPNPSSNDVFIQALLNNYGAYELQLYSMAGQLICKHQFTNSDLQHFSIANLQNGLYSYKIISKNIVQTGTLLKNE